MKVRISLILGLFLLIATGCDMKDEGNGIYIFSFTYNFNESDYEWEHGFSDYPAGPNDSARFELKYAYTISPGGNNALMLSGKNYSGNLFMFLKKKISGLHPDTDYTLTIDVELASQPENLTGTVVPYENVFLKVGATGMEPKSVVEQGNFVMNIDKGSQGQSGQDMVLIGDIIAPQNSAGYSVIYRSNTTAVESPWVVRTDSNGDLWLIVGTDSAFEGTTTLYYTRINVALSSPN